MYRLVRLVRRAAISRPLLLPPTNARQSTASLSTSASLSWLPEPLTRLTGRPHRRATAWAAVSVNSPPSDGVFEIAALPQSTCTSTECISTDIG